ncbi:hypothetical protein ABG79_01403 [Caloramator mitchellensis]|uniref:Phage-Barnase-EndoU-ColicinE5/D-RelE like nuclease 3 domain-containing protein n=1 Tax=Caloramator mitchellensis TaxID=908809 RepID=A0A0R3JTP6_CALMK|nr:PBECR2 nuclease fold domain-containing protein [Caloramator mitchellensis]KRQ86912.1 hypothetical protein ABG79_01403 [Caloramator mitchellensis]
MSNHKIVGFLNKKIIDMLGIDIKEGTEIILGESNIEHMKIKHPNDYQKYGDKIIEIINTPTYVCKHPKKDSIEFIKVFINENNDHVLVAVRASGKGILYVRTLFVMSLDKVEKYKSKGAFKYYD